MLLFCRKMFIILCWYILINSCISDEVAKTTISTSHFEDNFLIIDHLNDNEKELRLKWRDLMGKETTLDAGDNERFVNR